MPAVIVTASPKGGVGKTTLTLLLAAQFASEGYRTTVIETDPARHIETYVNARKSMELQVPFGFYYDDDADTLGDTIRNAAAESDIVMVDLAGSGDVLMTRAIARAHLVLIPMRAMAMDVKMADSAIRRIRIEEDHLDREITYRIVLNFAGNKRKDGRPVAQEASEGMVRDHITNKGYHRFQTEVTDRKGAFRNFYNTMRTLPEVIKDSGGTDSLAKAQAEIEGLAGEVITLIEDNGQ